MCIDLVRELHSKAYVPEHEDMSQKEPIEPSNADIEALEQCAQCDTRTLNRFVIQTDKGQIVHCICNTCYSEWVE